MRRLRLWWRRVAGVFAGDGAERALDQEIRTHIEMQVDENLRTGMSREEARRRAHVTFGTMDAAKESYRDQRGLPVVDALRQDFTYAWRSLRGNPGFTLVAVLSIAIGVGANTAIFSVVKTVILDPLGFREPERLFAVREVIPQWGSGADGIPVSPRHAREWARDCRSIEQVAVAGSRSFHLAGPDGPEAVPGARVSPNFVSVFGVPPLLGRAFTTDEAQVGRNRVVILSEQLWRRRFQRDRTLVGKPVTLDNETYTVVGVMPSSFHFPFGGGMTAQAHDAELLTPLVIPESEMRPVGNHNYAAVAQLRHGATPAQALAEINTVQKRFPQEAGLKIEMSAMLVPIQDVFTGNVRTGLWTLLGAVGSVMLVVCVNLANLLLAKNSARRRESAIRSALGASAGRQLRQGLAESLALAFTGGVLGIGLAALALQAILRWAPAELYRVADVRLNPAVLAFAMLVSLATGLLFGALPAWQLSRTHPIEALRSGGRSATAGKGSLATRRVLIGVEVALSAALLILGGLLGNSFLRLMRVDKGFHTEHLLTADLSVPGRLYREADARARLLDRTLARVRTIPGIESAAIISKLPGQGETWIDPIALEHDSRPQVEWPMVNHRFVSPAYFQTMRIEIRRGREFETSDYGKPVVILSEKAAAKLWPQGGEHIGERIRTGLRDQVATLIGIAADTRATVDRDPPPIAYGPHWLMPPYGLSIVMRTAAADPMSLASAVRRAVWSQEPQMPIPEIRTMQHVVDGSLAQRRFQLMLVAAFSAFALIVAALGVYGVVAFTVARRRSELGIRLALGAEPGRVIRAVVAQGLSPVVVGLAAGVGLALLLGRLIQGLLFEVRPADPVTIGVVCAAVLTVALAACVVPAWRAVVANPVAALRAD